MVIKDMNKKNVVFLGGPIQQAVDMNGQFNGNLKNLIIDLIDVFETSDIEVLSAHAAESFGDSTPHDSGDITARDYRWMQLCDVYIAIFFKNGHNDYIKSDGTHIELGWASAMGKPIILIGDNLPNEQNSHLVRGLGTIASVEFMELKEVVLNPANLITSVQRVN